MLDRIMGRAATVAALLLGVGSTVRAEGPPAGDAGKSGIDREFVTPDVRPQDDLFRHVSGRWLDSAPIPPDRAMDGAFYRLRDQSEADLRKIIEATAAKGTGSAEAQEGRRPVPPASWTRPRSRNSASSRSRGTSTGSRRWATRPASSSWSPSWVGAASRGRSASASTPTPRSPTATSSRWRRAGLGLPGRVVLPARQVQAGPRGLRQAHRPDVRAGRLDRPEGGGRPRHGAGDPAGQEPLGPGQEAATTP